MRVDVPTFNTADLLFSVKLKMLYEAFLLRQRICFILKEKMFQSYQNIIQFQEIVIGLPHFCVSSFPFKCHRSLSGFASRHASITHLQTFSGLHLASIGWRKEYRFLEMYQIYWNYFVQLMNIVVYLVNFLIISLYSKYNKLHCLKDENIFSYFHFYVE